jgi:uroporphyrinogen-III synthase
MNDKFNILATKNLSLDLLKLFNQSKLNVVAMDFISTIPYKFDTKELLQTYHWIISSQTTFRILEENYTNVELNKINFYCVGEQTKTYILKQNYNVVEWAHYSKDLAKILITKYKDINYNFIGGEMRRDELPSLLKNQNVSFKMINIYKTVLSPHEIINPFDGILFFSPSAIRSYIKLNTFTNENLFCIGQTTAKEAFKYSNLIHVANSPSFKSVIESVNTYYNEQ